MLSYVFAKAVISNIMSFPVEVRPEKASFDDPAVSRVKQNDPRQWFNNIE